MYALIIKPLHGPSCKLKFQDGPSVTQKVKSILMDSGLTNKTRKQNLFYFIELYYPNFKISLIKIVIFPSELSPNITLESKMWQAIKYR